MRAPTTRLVHSHEGQRFGSWLVGEHVGNGSWRATCDCGATRVVLGGNLRTGKTTSCGPSCPVGETPKKTHGFSRRGPTKLIYQRWVTMIARCHNHKSPSFKGYGARGLRVCDGWREDFEAFARDVGPRPSPKHSLDRRDNDRGYDCGRCADCVARGADANCRWATATEQNRNKRDNVFIEHDGRRLCVTEWAALTGIGDDAIAKRLARGWTVARALTQPSERNPSRQRRAA